MSLSTPGNVVNLLNLLVNKGFLVLQWRQMMSPVQGTELQSTRSGDLNSHSTTEGSLKG